MDQVLARPQAQRRQYGGFRRLTMVTTVGAALALTVMIWPQTGPVRVEVNSLVQV